MCSVLVCIVVYYVWCMLVCSVLCAVCVGVKCIMCGVCWCVVYYVWCVLVCAMLEMLRPCRAAVVVAVLEQPPAAPAQHHIRPVTSHRPAASPPGQPSTAQPAPGNQRLLYY